MSKVVTHRKRNAGSFWLSIALLVGTTVLVYARVSGFPFVEWDDPEYISRNPMVQSGFTFEGVRWALLSTELANWFPLTGLSFMSETQLFGVNASVHHVTNLVLHCLNATLLFVILRRATGRCVASWFVAALFALHPLHVESVAWISERKGLLSTLFALLAIREYFGYAASRHAWRYGLVVILFGASLLSKPMLVTLPLLLFLLDVWPLRRIGLSARSSDDAGRPSRSRLLLEKVPLLLMSLVYSAVTFYAQDTAGATRGSDLITLPERLANAVVATTWYLEKAVWPTDLCALYTHPYLDGGTPWPAWVVAGSALFLVAVSCGVFMARRHPEFAVGWLWYLISLLPVLGLVQVGIQPFADRYSYVPLIGIFVMIVFGLDEGLGRLARTRPWLPAAAVALGGLALLGFAVSARQQVETWGSSSRLFGRMLEVSPTNSVAHFKLGNEYRDAGQAEAAIERYQDAIRIHPGFVRARRELGRLLRERDRPTGSGESAPSP